jgi:hypothetical protein
VGQGVSSTGRRDRDGGAERAVRALIAALSARAGDGAAMLHLLTELLGPSGVRHLADRWYAARLLVGGTPAGEVAEALGWAPEAVEELARRLLERGGSGATAEILTRLPTDRPDRE